MINDNGFSFFTFLRENFEKVTSRKLFTCPWKGLIGLKNLDVRSDYLENMKILRPFPGPYKMAVFAYTRKRELVHWFIAYFTINIIGE